MRIISGTAKGHTIKAPKGLDTRPTQDRVRESIFNVLVSRWNIFDQPILDFFSGTGALVIEALSRGAGTGVAVDIKTGKLIVENARHCKVEDRLSVYSVPINHIHKKVGDTQFYVIFSDPPYQKGFVKETIDIIQKYDLLAPNGVLVLERHVEEGLELPHGWISQRELTFGDTRVNFCVQAQ